jgi:IS1 family transposase
VRRCCKRLCPILICTDGWNAYPQSILRAFREKVKRTPGRGRAALEVWSELYIGTVIKRIVNKRLKEVIHQMTRGSWEGAQKLLETSNGGSVLNTSFIERLNATMRERLATLTRKCRHATVRLSSLHTGMYLLGSTYNFCWPHQELSCVRDRTTGKRYRVAACTPAMAAGLTDHLWSVCELLSFKSAPAPWVEPKRRGRPRKQVPCASTS